MVGDGAKVVIIFIMYPRDAVLIKLRPEFYSRLLRSYSPPHECLALCATLGGNEFSINFPISLVHKDHKVIYQQSPSSRLNKNSIPFCGQTITTGNSVGKLYGKYLAQELTFPSHF